MIDKIPDGWFWGIFSGLIILLISGIFKYFIALCKGIKIHRYGKESTARDNLAAFIAKIEYSLSSGHEFPLDIWETRYSEIVNAAHNLSVHFGKKRTERLNAVLKKWKDTNKEYLKPESIRSPGKSVTPDYTRGKNIVLQLLHGIKDVCGIKT